MGLTKEQWKEKRISELLDYVKGHGKKVGDIIYWNTYPIVIKDICTLGAGIIDGELFFGDLNKDNTFRKLRAAKDIERKYLEEVLSDMKQLDKNKK